MNDLEFREQYKRLQEVHPYVFQSAEKLKTVWSFVQDMDEYWFRSLVDLIVMSAKGNKIDIGEAVAAERRHRKAKEFAEDVCEATKVWKGVSEQGLDRVLDKYKAKDLFEAVEKSRKGEL